MSPDLKWDIIVVCSAGEEIERKCLKGFSSLYSAYRLTIIDNRWSGRSWPVRGLYSVSHRLIQPHDSSLGWIGAANAGLALATAPYVLLCNDDIEVQDAVGMLQGFEQVFETFPRVGLIGPRTNSRYPQGRQLESRGLLETPLEQHPEKAPLTFFCVAIRKECREEVGYLDDRFRYGYGADDADYQWRARLLGWEMAVHAAFYVEHLGMGSFGLERRAREQPRNLKLLREKWGIQASPTEKAGTGVADLAGFGD